MKEQFANPWVTFAKKYVYTISPSTPSKQDIGHIDKYLQKILRKNKKPDILILGCTINYRKYLAKKKLFVTMVDVNKIMYDVNTEELKHIKRKEKLILANWIDMNLKKKYDLILGDFVVNNIKLRDRNKFYRNISKHLKNDGLFITRVFTQSKKFMSEKQLFSRYKNRKITRTWLTVLWWDGVFQFGFNTKTGMVYNKKGFLELNKKSKKYPYMKRWMQLYEERLPIEHKVWAVIKEARQKREAQKYFDFVKIEHSKDYEYHEICHNYVLKRK